MDSNKCYVCGQWHHHLRRKLSVPYTLFGALGMSNQPSEGVFLNHNASIISQASDPMSTRSQAVLQMRRITRIKYDNHHDRRLVLYDKFVKEQIIFHLIFWESVRIYPTPVHGVMGVRSRVHGKMSTKIYPMVSPSSPWV